MGQGASVLAYRNQQTSSSLPHFSPDRLFRYKSDILFQQMLGALQHRHIQFKEGCRIDKLDFRKSILIFKMTFRQMTGISSLPWGESARKTVIDLILDYMQASGYVGTHQGVRVINKVITNVLEWEQMITANYAEILVAFPGRISAKPRNILTGWPAGHVEGSQLVAVMEEQGKSSYSYSAPSYQPLADCCDILRNFYVFDDCFDWGSQKLKSAELRSVASLLFLAQGDVVRARILFKIVYYACEDQPEHAVPFVFFHTFLEKIFMQRGAELFSFSLSECHNLFLKMVNSIMKREKASEDLQLQLCDLDDASRLLSVLDFFNSRAKAGKVAKIELEQKPQPKLKIATSKVALRARTHKTPPQSPTAHVNNPRYTKSC